MPKSSVSLFELLQQTRGQEPAAPASKPMTKDDFNQMLGEIDQTMRDPITGKPRSVIADGSSPLRPVNQSPLTPDERLALAFGDEVGRAKTLVEKFADVRQDKDGNYVVLDKDNLWKRLDQKGFGDVDPWEATKKAIMGDKGDLQKMATEVLGDVSDAMPLIASVGGTIAAGVATGGASLMTQAAAMFGTGVATSLLNTSMGKLSGTYEGTPEEFIPEAAMEGFLNLAGVVIPPVIGKGIGLAGQGAKAAMQSQIAQGIIQAGKNIKVLPDGVKDLVAQSYGAMTGVGSAAIRRLGERSPTIGQYMDKALKAGRTGEGAQQYLLQSQIADVLTLAKNTRTAATKYYSANLEALKAELPEAIDFSANKAIKDILDDMVEWGLASVDDTGKIALKTSAELEAAINQGSKHQLVAQAAKGVAGGDQSWAILNRLVAVLRVEGQVAKNQVGFEGYRQASSVLRKELDDMVKAAYNSDNSILAHQLGLIKSNLTDKLDEGMDIALQKAGGSQSIVDKFRAINKDYADVINDVNPLLAVQKAHLEGNKQPAATYLRDLISTARSGGVRKEAAENAIEKLGPYSEELQIAYDRILDKEAASRFTPLVRGSFIQFAPVAVGSSMLVNDLSEGKVSPGSMGLIAMPLLTSPRLAFKVGTMGRGAGQVASQALLKSRQALMLMPEAKRLEMLQSPELMRQFLSMPAAAVLQYQNASQQLMGR